MEKSNHRYYGNIIKYDELGNFIEPVKANICISIDDLKHLLDQSDYSTIDYIVKVFNNLIDNNIPTLRWKLASRSKKPITCVTYNAHIDGYDFRFNPIDIINNIYKYLELDYEIPFINLDNPNGMNYFKDYVRSYTKDIKRTTNHLNKIAIVDEINTNIDSICSVYDDYNLNDYIKENAIPKDLLFYIAYRNLDLFEETGDFKYLVYAKEYYENVSHMQTSQYPHMIYIPNHKDKVWFNNFRLKYETLVTKPYDLNLDNLRLRNDEVLLAWDILKPGMVERELRDINERVRSDANVDYSKYQELFNMKMNYYLSSPYVKFILGKYGLNGYVGFSYLNDYLLFDKFHNSDTINPSRKTILTHPEAIFALPADRFSLLSGTKQTIIDEKEKDLRIKKINHTSNGSFIKKLNNIVYGPNVSTMTFEKALEEEKKHILIKK